MGRARAGSVQFHGRSKLFDGSGVVVLLSSVVAGVVDKTVQGMPSTVLQLTGRVCGEKSSPHAAICSAEIWPASKGSLMSLHVKKTFVSKAWKLGTLIRYLHSS